MKTERMEEILEEAYIMQKEVGKDVMLQKIYGKWYFPKLIRELEEKLEDLETAETLFQTS